MGKKLYDRTLSKKDDVSHSESLALIKHFRKDTESGLIIPEALKIERKKVCGFCGRPWETKSTRRYFGELFHEDCVKMMENGERWE